MLLHLGHPMFRQALTSFARLRFPGQKEVLVSRWTARRGAVPQGAEALVLVTVEEIGVNELREPFHHWVRTIRIPVKGGSLGAPELYVPPSDDRTLSGPNDEDTRRAALAIWDEISLDVGPFLKKLGMDLTNQVQKLLAAAGKLATAEEKKRYQHRLKEVEAAMRETTLAKIEKERDKLVAEQRQITFLPDRARELESQIADLNEELHRRRTHYQELLSQLEADQDRVLSRMLPRRYALHGSVQVFPVAIEIRLPSKKGALH